MRSRGSQNLEDSMSSNQSERIRVGLAGFGMSGQIFHAPYIAADDRFELKKVYERTTDRAREAYPGTETVRSFEELLTDDIDLVIITTPNALHVPMARQALEAGKNVVVEKPVASGSSEAAELCRLARDRGVLLTVYQNRRLDGDFLTVKTVMEDGDLGEVTDYECHFDRFVQGVSAKPWKREGGKGVDVLYDIGVHIIDQAYILFGMPDEVYADMRQERAESGGVDNFEVSLYYPDKKVILSATQIAALPGPHFMVHGREGSFLKHGFDPQEQALQRGSRPGDPGFGETPEEEDGMLCTVSEDGREIRTVKTITGNYGAYYDNLYRALTEGADLLVPPEQTVDVLRILEAAQQSSAEKRRVPVRAAHRG